VVVGRLNIWVGIAYIVVQLGGSYVGIYLSLALVHSG
jgi:hypothetical protein